MRRFAASPSDPPAITQAFGAARTGVGAISWLAPRLAARIFGLDPAAKDLIITQLFGAREVALGVLTARATGPARTQILRLGMVIDIADTAASIRQMRRGTLSTQATILVAAGAALFAATGAIALTHEQPPSATTPQAR